MGIMKIIIIKKLVMKLMRVIVFIVKILKKKKLKDN